MQEHGREDAGLPKAVAAAWGVQPASGRGPRRALSVEQIVAAAIGVAGRDGLATVSMSRVAAEVGVSTMALYRYVASKGELVALMADTAYGPPPEADDPDETWREGLARWAWAERAGLNAHRWVLEIPVGGMGMILPNQTAWLERALRCLRETALTETEKMSTVLLVTSYVRAEVGLTVEVEQSFSATGMSSQEAMASYGKVLARVASPEHFPHLHAVIASGMFEAEDGPDDEFRFGLSRILDGVEALIVSRAEH